MFFVKEFFQTNAPHEIWETITVISLSKKSVFRSNLKECFTKNIV